MVKKKLRNAIIAVCCICMLPFSACGGGNNSSSVSESSSVEDTGLQIQNTAVWTTYSTQKILHEADYSSMYEEKNLKISAFRNEYEAAQIVISAGEDGKYTVETAELKKADGTVLPSSAVSVYHEKLVYLETIKDKGVNTPIGYYPDGLLPYEKAVEYGENTVKKNTNQAIWVTVHADKTQAAGEYTGTYKVKVGTATYDIPVSVTVYDYTLSDDTYIKSLFMISYDWMSYAELDSTEEMAETYYNFFVNYRLGLNSLPCALNGGYTAYADNTEFLDDVVDAAKNTKCPLWVVPTVADTANIQYTDESGAVITLTTPSISEAPYKKFVKDVANRCVVEGMNLFEKAYTSMNITDEYDDVGKPNGRIYAKYNQNRLRGFNLDLAQWAAESLENTNPDLTDAEFETLKAEISTSIAGIKNLQTGVSINPLLNSPYEGEDPKVVFVPTIDAYSSPSSREALAAYAATAYDEMWAYTCVNPTSPYPTYHIEDDLISGRLLNWMMYEYNILGNLYWASALYQNLGTLQDWQIQDYYQEPLRYPNMNGDGYLVYPGRQYGIKGPVSSIRLETIRDGNEDYDLLHALESYYQAYGYTGEDFDSVLRYMTSTLYGGTKCYLGENDNVHFASSRKLLADLLVMTSNTGAVLGKVNVSKNNVVAEVVAPSGVEVSAAGATVSTKTSEDNTVYTLTFNLADRQTLDLSVVKDGKTYTTSIALGKPAVFVESTSLQDKVSSYKSSVEVKAELSTVETESVVKVTMEDCENGKPAFAMDLSTFNVDETYGKIVIRLYNYGEEIPYAFMGICENMQGYLSLTSGTLQSGWNEIVIDLAALNCKQNGKVTLIRANFIDEDNLITDPLALAVGQIVLEG